jgi:lipopolysaccharide transport system permease protein
LAARSLPITPIILERFRKGPKALEAHDGKDFIECGQDCYSMSINWFKELWRYRELLYFLVWRDLKVRYKQTVLGIAWAVIQPLFTMFVFFFFFGKMAQIPSDGLPYPVFSYSALVAWTYFSAAGTYGANSLIGNTNLLTKVYFPRATIPCAAVISGLPDFAIASVMMVGILFYYQMPLGWELLLWPLLALPLALLALGVSLLLSALNVKYRDIKYAVPFGFQLWMFASPIVYPVSIVPEHLRMWLALNPLAGIIEAFRSLLVPSRALDWNMLAISLAASIAVFVLGSLYFYKAERTFADII